MSAPSNDPDIDNCGDCVWCDAHLAEFPHKPACPTLTIASLRAELAEAMRERDRLSAWGNGLSRALHEREMQLIAERSTSQRYREALERIALRATGCTEVHAEDRECKGCEFSRFAVDIVEAALAGNPPGKP